MGYGARQGAPKPCSSRNSECDLLWKQRRCLYKQVGMKTPRTIVAQLVKKPPAMQETSVRSLGWEDPLAKGKATHSSLLAWRIPWTTVHGVAKSRTRRNDSHFHPGSRRTQSSHGALLKRRKPGHGDTPRGKVATELTFLPGLLRPSRGHLVPTCSSASPVSKGFIGFLSKPRNISLFLSLLLSYCQLWTTRFQYIKDLKKGVNK